jgi:hypothetical protein
MKSLHRHHDEIAIIAGIAKIAKIENQKPGCEAKFVAIEAAVYNLSLNQRQFVFGRGAEMVRVRMCLWVQQ